MFAALTSWQDLQDQIESTRGGPPPLPQEPLLMGDLLTHRNGDPEFLIRWRKAQARNEDQS